MKLSLWLDSCLRRNDKKLYSYLFDDLTVSFIFESDIFAIQEESHDDEDESIEHKPVVSRHREWNWYIRSTSYICKIYSSSIRWWYWMSYDSLIFNHEKWYEDHDNTESKHCPFPDFLPKNTWIEYTSDESDSREDEETISHPIWESELRTSHSPAEEDGSKDDESKHDTSYTDRLIGWFLGEFGDDIHHNIEVLI